MGNYEISMTLSVCVLRVVTRLLHNIEIINVQEYWTPSSCVVRYVPVYSQGELLTHLLGPDPFRLTS